MNFEKYSAEKSIVESGSTILFDPTSNFILKVSCDESFKFDLVFDFESTDENKHDIEATVDGQIIKLKCINFNNVAGIGTNSAVEIATYNGKRIFLNFWVTPLGSQSLLKKIDYSIYFEQ